MESDGRQGTAGPGPAAGRAAGGPKPSEATAFRSGPTEGDSAKACEAPSVPGEGLRPAPPLDTEAAVPPSPPGRSGALAPSVDDPAAPAGDRRGIRVQALFVGLGAAAVAVSLAALAWGAADLSVGRVAQILAHAAGWPGVPAPDAWEETIVVHLRLPRLILGLLVGAGLGVAGGMMQGIFRNPLADPSLIGVSSGAALGAATMIVAGNRLLPELPGVVGGLLVPAAAFTGGLLATIFVHRLAVRNRRTGITTMLLAGIAINALASAGTGLWTFVADDAELRDLTFWTLGSLAGAQWGGLAVVGGVIATAGLIGIRTAPALDAMLLGEAEAHHVGIDAEKIRRRTIACTAAMVGSAVALSGLIFFVGLVVPHIIRLAMGPGHRVLLPAAAMLGGTLLVAADVAARLVVAPAELPIGIVTALVGAPFFLALVRRGTE